MRCSHAIPPLRKRYGTGFPTPSPCMLCSSAGTTARSGSLTAPTRGLGPLVFCRDGVFVFRDVSRLTRVSSRVSGNDFETRSITLEPFPSLKERGFNSCRCHWRRIAVLAFRTGF